MRTLATLVLAVLLCGCGGGQQNSSGIHRAGKVGNETTEKDLPAVRETAKPAELIDAAKRIDIQSVEKTIETIKRTENPIPALIEALQDDEHFVQLAAATALSEIGKQAVPDVTKLLSNKDENVRSWATAITDAIEKPSETAVQSGFARSVQPESQPGRLRNVPRIPVELKPALIALRRGETLRANELVWEHRGALKRWLSGVLVNGRTSRDDILTLLGPALKDLDRPKRDAIVTAQYVMGSSASYTTLVFDFDAKTGLLTHWSTSQGICGFCPHVFANDGRWRLEGKLLAGCIGPGHEGTDTLVLSRLVELDGRLRVKVSNLAPETEFLDQIQLGMVPLNDGEELDVGHDGRPFAWRSSRELPVEIEPAGGQYAVAAFDLDHRLADDVIVLEARNTSAFESTMREFVLGNGEEPAFTEVQIQFDRESPIRIEPVGTKFLRRVVIPIPHGSRELKMRWHREMWIVRRIWIGTGRTVDAAMRWQTPIVVRGAATTALALVSTVDRRRLELAPDQTIEVGFLPAQSGSNPARSGYVFRITGYYEFQRQAGVGAR